VTRILVLFHSVTGSTYRLAEAIAEGIRSVEDCQANLRKVPEIDGSEAIFGGDDMAEARAEFDHVPLAEIADLIEHDGLAIGSPTYFGTQSSALRFFLDQAGKYWMEGSLTGKPATAFTAGGSGAGRETTLMSLWSTFAVFGLTIVPLGIRAQSVSPNDKVTGTTPFGAATISGGDGDRPSEAELAAARIQGRALAEITQKMTAK
jgi:NAD(P)H dehydrogenase (quinone)|tara:strand:+ start:843 stop:1457 length:615 start_codon:yes stop_codon:yes gene_type:complete